MADPITLAVIAVLVLAAGFCAGAAFGAWLSEPRAYRAGIDAGMAKAAQIYARPPVDRVPTVKGRV